MFRFAATDALFAMLLVPMLVILLWYAARRTRRALQQFGEIDVVQHLTDSVSRRGRGAKRLLVLAAVVLLVTALARPQFGTRIETVRREGMDIIVALDLSTSMLAEDIAPNRLDNAKFAVSELIARLDGDRIGLVAFAGEAFVQSPLTLDYAAATMFLNAMEPDIISVPGTDLGAALDVALDAFDPDAPQDRVLIVITDGEDHEGAVGEAMERAVDAGVRIYTVGVGTPDGVPIPDIGANGRRRGFKRDDAGNVVTTRLDEATLRDMAQRTGGRYYRATPRGSELRRLADELTGEEGQTIEARQVTRFEEQYQLFLGAALVLLTLEVLIPDRRRRTTTWSGRFG